MEYVEQKIIDTVRKKLREGRGFTGADKYAIAKRLQVTIAEVEAAFKIVCPMASMFSDS